MACRLRHQCTTSLQVLVTLDHLYRLWDPCGSTCSFVVQTPMSCVVQIFNYMLQFIDIINNHQCPLALANWCSGCSVLSFFICCTPLSYCLAIFHSLHRMSASTVILSVHTSVIALYVCFHCHTVCPYFSHCTACLLPPSYCLSTRYGVNQARPSSVMPVKKDINYRKSSIIKSPSSKATIFEQAPSL